MVVQVYKLRIGEEDSQKPKANSSLGKPAHHTPVATSTSNHLGSELLCRGAVLEPYFSYNSSFFVSLGYLGLFSYLIFDVNLTVGM